MSVFSEAFCIFQCVTSGRVVVFHVLKLRKQIFAYKKKICLSEPKFVKYHEAAKFCVCREPYQ